MIGQTSLDQGLLALKAGQFDAAVGFLERACSEFPNDYRGFNYLGVAYAQKKLYDRAVGAFQTAMSIRPNIANIHYNLGLAYQADGLHDLAREAYRTALRLDPDYAKAAEALDRLAEEDEGMTPLSAQACARHTDEPAVGVCSFCHLPVCKACKVVVADQVFCAHCAGK
ncbi:MAG: tetratricopeptide repeat protein [Armatimonadetes bacterium]|nr:tetratricopeptide repeat protein [Armatimonadota bacterium]